MAIIRYSIKSLLYKLASIAGWTTVCRSSWLRILSLATQNLLYHTACILGVLHPSRMPTREKSYAAEVRCPNTRFNLHINYELLEIQSFWNVPLGRLVKLPTFRFKNSECLTRRSRHYAFRNFGNSLPVCRHNIQDDVCLQQTVIQKSYLVASYHVSKTLIRGTWMCGLSDLNVFLIFRALYND